MAKKKRKRGPRSAPVAAEPAAAAAPRGGANVVRRERKEEARRLREAELRRARRSSALRRTGISLGIAAAAVAGITLFRSVTGPNEIPQAAKAAATVAGCTEVVRPAASAPGDQHLDPGAPFEYEDPPATSGFHDPSPLIEPKVFDTQPPETQAVHSLEHGAIFVYYLPESAGGVPQAIVDRLATLAQDERATFLAPYPNLSADRALTLTAWNRRQSCPVGEELTPERAVTIVSGFVEAFRCTSNAPEGSSPPC